MNTQLSLSQLIAHAHFFVQIIMLLLFLGGVYALYTFFKKIKQFQRLEALQQQFNQRFMSSQNLEDLYQQYLHTRQPIEGVLRIFMMGLHEFKQFQPRHIAPELIESSCQRSMESALYQEEQNLQRDLNHLASIASAAPYVGLLGTVFGIMNSFIAIGSSGNTSISSVAPGIAEALIATGIGLLTAITALLAYQFLQARANRLQHLHEHFIDTFTGVLLHRCLVLRERQA